MMFDRLSNTDQIAIWVNDSKLSHPLRRVFKNVDGGCPFWGALPASPHHPRLQTLGRRLRER
jgi:hypothetical protein